MDTKYDKAIHEHLPTSFNIREKFKAIYDIEKEILRHFRCKEDVFENSFEEYLDEYWIQVDDSTFYWGIEESDIVKTYNCDHWRHGGKVNGIWNSEGYTMVLIPACPARGQHVAVFLNYKEIPFSAKNKMEVCKA